MLIIYLNRRIITYSRTTTGIPNYSVSLDLQRISWLSLLSSKLLWYTSFLSSFSPICSDFFCFLFIFSNMLWFSLFCLTFLWYFLIYLYFIRYTLMYFVLSSLFRISSSSECSSPYSPSSLMCSNFNLSRFEFYSAAPAVWKNSWKEEPHPSSASPDAARWTRLSYLRFSSHLSSERCSTSPPSKNEPSGSTAGRGIRFAVS